jgi:hypothetical protein
MPESLTLRKTPLSLDSHLNGLPLRNAPSLLSGDEAVALATLEASLAAFNLGRREGQAQ